MMERTPEECPNCGATEVIRIEKRSRMKADHVRWACGVWSDVNQPRTFEQKHTCPFIKRMRDESRDAQWESWGEDN